MERRTSRDYLYDEPAHSNVAASGAARRNFYYKPEPPAVAASTVTTSSRLGALELELIEAKGKTQEKRQKAQRLYAERAASDRCFHHGAWDWNIIMKVRAEHAKKEEESN